MNAQKQLFPLVKYLGHGLYAFIEGDTMLIKLKRGQNDYEEKVLFTMTSLAELTNFATENQFIKFRSPIINGD